MPDRLACNDAMYFPKVRLRVKDPDLKNGEVEKTLVGQVLMPWGMQGGFAVVYKFRTQSGEIRALRCYLVPMKADIQYRYERIGVYFASHIPDFTAGFKYHNDGILIDETMGRPDTRKPYSLIEMEWIEGTTLIEHVATLCQRRDSAGLADVLDQWVVIIRAMRKARIAHCDLAGGNIMVRSNGRLVLVDYDGVYIPDFIGMPGIVDGQADYQHPEMSKRPFNEEADNFSAMVIYTALLALSVRPEIWQRYASQNTQNKAQDTNLLFKKEDFANPNSSRLFSELEGINNVRLRTAVQVLKHACQLPIAQVRLPPYIGDPDIDKKEALEKLERAIQLDNDEEIVKTWLAPLLDTYAPAQKYRTRLTSAKQMLQKLQHFRGALQRGLMQQIIDAYDPSLDHYKNVRAEERDLLRLAREFQEAYNNNDDDALVAVWDEILLRNYNVSFMLTWQEEQRRNIAQRRKAALAGFKQALANKNVQEIVDTYDRLLDSSPHVTSEEREILQLAQHFIRVYKDDDDQDIINAYETIQHSANRSRLNCTAQEKRISLARQRIATLETFRRVLINKNVQEIVAAYNPILDTVKNVTYDERKLLRAAKDFVQAYNDGDDQAIVASSQVINESYQQSLTFTGREEQRIIVARLRVAALNRFRQALLGKLAEQIVASYDPILTDCKNVTREEREQIALAIDLVQAYNGDDDQSIINSWQDIQRSRYQSAFVLTTTEEQRLAFAQKRIAALQQFHTVASTRSREAAQIISAYDPILDNYAGVTPEERNLLQMAHQFLLMHQTVLDGIRNDNDEQILSAYDEAIAHQFPDFTQQQQERINRALKYRDLEKELQNNNYGNAIQLAQEIEMESRKQITDFRLTLARRKFIRQFEVKDVVAWRQNDEVVVQWRWPTDELVRYAVIVWRIDRWPQSPKREEPGTGREMVLRGRYEHGCTARFKANLYMAVYLQVYFAIPDYTQQPPTWFYSDGNGSGSKTAAYYSGPDTKVI